MDSHGTASAQSNDSLSDGYTARSRAVSQNFFLALHPVQVRRASIRPLYSLGLGLLSAYSLVIMFVTGILLMFHYVPQVDAAYASMVRLETDVFLGGLIKNLHFVSGHALLVFSLAHLFRVFFTGAYAGRSGNWVVGVIMLLIAMLTVATGYVLPWDQGAYWVTVGASEIVAQGPILGEWVQLIVFGGDDVGQATLTRFYTLHFLVGPLLLLALSGLHVFLIRSAGGLAAGGDQN